MEPAIKYRLIKKEKHTGARLGEIVTPHGTLCRWGPKPALKQWPLKI